MSDTVISVENLSKQYRLGAIGGKTLTEDLNRWIARLRGKPDPYLKIGQEDWRQKGRRRETGDRSPSSVPGPPSSVLNPPSPYIWALKDVSFEVKQGEVLGIIGRNGAGKSTLLKILSRVTAPTAGQVKVKGRIASLLEVGTGFHPELTGRENIFLNGAILGMSKKEIATKFDMIVDFAEIDQFIETPVKRYSSGMYVRLAFAVAAHLEPEILVVDEVLAVGDAQFQKKCLGKMEDVAQQGKTVLFVSHNMTAIRQLCTIGVLLVAGNVHAKGEISKCINSYMELRSLIDRKIIDHITYQDNSIRVINISINNQVSDHMYFTNENPRLNLLVEGVLLKSMRIEIEVRVTDVFGTPLALFSPGHLRGYTEITPAGSFILERTITLPIGINRGDYYLNISITEPNMTGWVDIPKAVRISAEGFATDTGRAIDYTSGAGWLFLHSNDSI